ncbi:MAG TPA: CHASE3 domain-containing protein [Blastocatellia bacterium]|jgi:signal transduction histidine kinase|nr:CHASE3 domain-containing protein [Blastocatellia bacterium]
MKHGVERRLVVWFGAAYLIVILMFALSYLSAQQLRESEVFWVEHGYQIIASLESSYITLKEAESDQRTYLINNNQRSLNLFKAAENKFRAQIDQLKTLTADNPSQFAHMRKLEALGIERLDILQNQIQLKQEHGGEAVRQEILEGPGMRKMAETYSLVNELKGEEESLLAERRARSAAGARNVMWSLGALGGAVMATLAMAYMFINREMIRRRRTAEELRSLNEELEERVALRTAEIEASNKELEAFSYSVSHDLRAPLRHVSSFANLLREHAANSIDETSANYLRRIIEAANGMGRLIDGLLIFSRLGRMEMSRDPVNLNQLTEEALQELQPEIEGREIVWRIGELPVVEGHRETLRAVLVNLLSNAIKFTRPRRPAQIEVGCREARGEAVCFVRDNGVGFDMRYAGKLFGVFQRLHHAKEFEGTGIGLANVQRIISRHGGRIWAEGEVGRGATFYFSLPLRAAALSDARREDAKFALRPQMA